MSRSVLSCALARCYALYRKPPRPCHALYRDTTPCRKPLPVTIQNLYRDLAPAAAHCNPCHERCRTCRSPQCHIVAYYCAVSQPWICCIATQRSPLSHDTMFCIATPPGQAMRARALSQASHAGWPYRRPYRGLIRPCRGLSLPYRGRVLCAPAARCVAPPGPVSRYTPLYRDSTQANGQ